MNDYFIMWEVAKEWKVATEKLRDSVRIAVEARFHPAIAGSQPVAGIGLVLVYIAFIVIWMVL